MGKNSLVNRGDLIGTFFKEALCFVPSVLALIFLTGCVSSASTKTQGFTSIPSTASIPVLPATATIIPSPTFTSTPIFTPTPTHPSLPAPVVPNVSANISVDNVSKLTRVISLGEGDLMNIQLSPDGKWIVLGTENGVLVLDSTTLAKVLFLPTAMKPKIISFIDNDNKLTATDCYTGNVWTFPDGKLISHVHFNWMNPNQYSLSCTSIPDSNWEYAFGTTESEYNHGAPSESKAGLYRLIDGKIQYTVNYQAGNFSISPDSKLVALKTPDKLVIIQYQDGKVIQEIPGTGIKSVFFIPDGKTLVTVFQNKIEFRSVGDFHLIDTIVAYNIRSYFLSPDSSILVITTTDNTIRLVRVEDQLLINTVSGISLTFSSDNQGFIVDSGQGQVRYFSLNAEKSKIAFKKTFTGKGIYPQENLFYKFPNSTGYGYHFEYSAGFFSADNKKIFLNPVSDQWDYRSDLRELSIYDVSTGLLIKKFPYFPDFLGTTLTGTVWLPSLQTFGVLLNNIYTGTTFATLDIQSGSFSKIIDNNKRVRQAVGFSPQGDLLVSAQGNKVFSWDIKNNGYWQLPVDQKVTAGTDYMGSRNISFSPDGKTIAISDLYDGTSFINSVDYSRINITNQNKFFYLKNGYSGCTDGKKIIISSAQGNIINQFDAANITDLDYNETRNILATASIEGLKVWDLSDYSNTKLLFSGKLTSYNLYYGSVRFSPDGKYVAARTYFSADLQQQGVSIWNTETGQLIPDLEVGFVKDLAFFPDSKMIALSINDIFGGSLISIFDLSTGKSIFSTEAGYFQSHFPPSLAFSPDGKFLAVLPAYGYVSIWGIP